MPIQSGDVKLLKSAVMADVPEGGGAPTGNTIADGVSNAIFPDISELDRAGGRVNLRKSFVSVQTDDRDRDAGARRYEEAPELQRAAQLAEDFADDRVEPQGLVAAGVQVGGLRNLLGLGVWSQRIQLAAQPNQGLGVTV